MSGPLPILAGLILAGLRSVLFAFRDRRFHEDGLTVIPLRSGATHLFRMNRTRARCRASCLDTTAIPIDLYDYTLAPVRRPGPPVKHDLVAWRVIDDWPERVPVTECEVDVFEAWFGAIIDELFESP
ncbi:MAG TPA: hypothetical protein VJY33_19265 [Isosphaeraceae bacterium]|nr:hypothetical protein [Isosphaeraceae bacterium]